MFKLPEFKNPSLLHCAFVHESYRNENPEEKENNERLEFLGDALLGFLVGSLLYEHYPQMDEGKLSILRSNLVKQPKLAEFAKKFNLGQKILLGWGEKSKGDCNNLRLLSSTFEAVIGAYYLDSGIKAVNDFLNPLFLEAAENIVDENYIGMLQEWSVPQFGEPKYDPVSESGADHNKEFIFKVCIKGENYGTGKGHRKQEARQRAAENALKKLGFL